MYKGPSKIYGVVDGNSVIPKGTIIKYECADQMWAYTTYNGVSGWVYIYQYIQYYDPYGQISDIAYIKKMIINIIDIPVK